MQNHYIFGNLPVKAGGVTYFLVHVDPPLPTNKLITWNRSNSWCTACRHAESCFTAVALRANGQIPLWRPSWSAASSTTGRRITTVTEDTIAKRLSCSSQWDFCYTLYGISLTPTPLRGSSKGECGFLPVHHDHRVKRHCIHYIFLTSIFTHFSFVLTGQIIIIIIILWRND